MARPDPDEKAAREKRRSERAQICAEVMEREAEVHVNVQGIVKSALVKSKRAIKPPDMLKLLDELEEARCLALAANEPAAAVTATMSKAKLLGLIVDKQAVAIGAPGDFVKGDTPATIEQKLADRFGEARGRAGDEVGGGHAFGVRW
jgi:hypothetical protein